MKISAYEISQIVNNGNTDTIPDISPTCISPNDCDVYDPPKTPTGLHDSSRLHGIATT